MLDLDQVKKFEKADGILYASPDVEDLAAYLIHVIPSCQECLEQVFHIEDVPYLLAIPIDMDRAAFDGLYKKMRHPPLVFGAELVWAINTTHSEHDSLKVVGTGIIQHILVCGSFRTAVRAVEIEGLTLTDAILFDVAVYRIVAGFRLFKGQIGRISIDFVSGGKDQRGLVRGSPNSLQQVEGTLYVDFEIKVGVIQTCGYCDLGS